MLGVRGKILGTSVLAVVLGIAIAAFLNGRTFEEEYTKSLQSEVKVIGRNLRAQLERIRSLGLDVEDIKGFEDQCRQVLQEHPYLSYAMVARQDGRVLFHNNPASQGTTLKYLTWLPSSPTNQQYIHVFRDDRDQEFCEVALPSRPDDTGWVFVIVGFPSRLITAKVHELVTKSVLFGSASLVLAIVLLLLTISMSVTQPLSKLVDAIRQIRSSGKLDRQVDVASKDEIGVLATSFNEMVTSLRKARDELEDRVAERTNELSQANQNLRQEIVERKRAEDERGKALRRQQGINLLQQSLLAPGPIGDRLRIITEGIVHVFNADFCRVWLIRPGDLCERDCIHAEVQEGPHVCRYRDRCLHLLASSGRYTHTDGKDHRRVPFGCYKIGRVASDREHKFLTNDVLNDPRVHNHEWARELGLVSFAGYQLRVPGAETLGVLALFAKHPISPDEDAMLDGLSSTVALVIQQAAAEEELRESEERFRIVAERTGQLIYGHDVASGQIQWAGAIEEVTGHSPQEFANVDIKGWENMIHPEDRPGVMQALEQTVRHGASFHYPYRFARKDGNYLYIEASAVILRDPHGEAVRMLGTMKDITQRKLAEDELKRSHELLEQRVQERTLELVRANEQIRQAQADLVQAEKMGMLGQLVAGVAHEINTPTGAIMNVAADAATHLRGLAAVAAGELGRLDEEVCRWLVEQIPDILSHKAAFPEVTDRKAHRQVEEELKRQGITDVRRAAEVLAECGLSSSNPQAIRCLSTEAGLRFLEHLVALRVGSEITLTSIQKIAKIVKALRYYSRSGEGELFDINLSESLDNTLVILQNHVKHIARVERSYAEDVPSVRCGGDISQVWTNILSNACDAIEGAGLKGKGLIRITISRRDHQAVVQVFNGGSTILPEILPRIFDPFFTTKCIGKGTGLGLSICTGILRKYHGTITARNESDGVTFEVTLPLSQSEPAQEEGLSPDAEAVAQQTG